MHEDSALSYTIVALVWPGVAANIFFLPLSISSIQLPMLAQPHAVAVLPSKGFVMQAKKELHFRIQSTRKSQATRFCMH